MNELENLKDKTEFIIKNAEIVEASHLENYLRGLEKIRYNIFNKIKIREKYVADEEEKINYLNKAYKASVENDILKILLIKILCSM